MKKFKKLTITELLSLRNLIRDDLIPELEDAIKADQYEGKTLQKAKEDLENHQRTVWALNQHMAERAKDFLVK